MKNKFLIFMATITFFLTVAVVGILLKPELYESKTTVIKENDSMQSEVDEKNIESEVSNQEEWGSGDVYDGSSPIIRKMGEKLSVIGIPHRKQGDKPPMSTEVFAYWEGEMVFTVDVSMFARSVEVVTNGQIAWVEVIIIAWISSICMLVGYLYLKNSDIINKHR